MSSHGGSWPLIEDVFISGPSDGGDLLNLARERSPFEALYLATRSSVYAETWRIEFGKKRDGPASSKCILDTALGYIAKFQHGDPQSQQQARQNVEYTMRMIANCCANNNVNRKIIIHQGGVKILMDLLISKFDTNIVVPTMYNVCVDYDEPATNWHSSQLSQNGDFEMVTLAEEQLATQGQTDSVFSGVRKLLHPSLLSKCEPDILQYLAELTSMAAKPVALVQIADIRPGETSVEDVLAALLAINGGILLSSSSINCRIEVCRALLAIASNETVRIALACTGDVFQFVLMAHYSVDDQDYVEEDPETLEDVKEAIKTIQAAFLKVLYEICQLPQFTSQPKYGAARLSLEVLLANPDQASDYLKAAALITLYGFVDNDVRAVLIVSEGLVFPLLAVLSQANDKTAVYPAVALASKLAVTWRMRSLLVEFGIIEAVQHLLLGSNLGFEVPLNSVILLELLIKGHPTHVSLLCTKSLTTEHSGSVVDDLKKLYNRGHDAINFEIGRLLMEICATLAQSPAANEEAGSFSLDTFLQYVNSSFLTDVFIFMATKGQTAGQSIAKRVWFALGLLSTTSRGRSIVQKVLQNPEIHSNLNALSQVGGTPAHENVKFMLHNLNTSSPILSMDADDDLGGAMMRMQLQ